jgi:hypothetical protein
MLCWRIDTGGLITLVHSDGARDPDHGRDHVNGGGLAVQLPRCFHPEAIYARIHLFWVLPEFAVCLSAKKQDAFLDTPPHLPVAAQENVCS